jgi:hypothetical protein
LDAESVLFHHVPFGEFSGSECYFFLHKTSVCASPLQSALFVLPTSDLKYEVPGADSTVTAFLSGGMAPYDTVGENGCLVVSFVTGFLHARSLR